MSSWSASSRRRRPAGGAGGAPRPQALAAGEGEMANVGVDGLLLLVAQGATDLKAVTSPNKSLPYVIVAKDDIKTVADLAGKDVRYRPRRQPRPFAVHQGPGG